MAVDYDRDERVLRTESSAGGFPIDRVRLVDARGRVREPDAAVREGPEVVGGVSLGTGIGTGYGGYGGFGRGGGIGLGTGVGVGRTSAAASCRASTSPASWTRRGPRSPGRSA